MPLFESASRQMEDAELQQFASATLLKLRDHQQQAEKLAQAAKPAASDPISNPELLRR